MEYESNTHLSLLMRIKRGERREESWRAFVERYGVRIYHWCLSRNLRAEDADDVTQNVLLKLAKRLETFEYQPSGSFRLWLRKVTENALNDFFRDQIRHRKKALAGDVQALQEVEAQQDLVDRLNDAFDLEIFERAVERAQQRVSEARFRAWDLTARQGMAGVEVARQLGMQVATVYTAKNQVQSLIQQEVRKLEQETGTH